MYLFNRCRQNFRIPDGNLRSSFEKNPPLRLHGKSFLGKHYKFFCKRGSGGSNNPKFLHYVIYGLTPYWKYIIEFKIIFLLESCLISCFLNSRSVFIPFHKVFVIKKYVAPKTKRGKTIKIISKNMLNIFSYSIGFVGHTSRHLWCPGEE